MGSSRHFSRPKRRAISCAGFAALVLTIFANHTSGQTLTNGFDQAGMLVLGTTNSDTFYATNGDTILLRMGAPFRPLATLRAPNGTVITSAAGPGSGSLDTTTIVVTANTNGLFTASASSYYGNGAGAYRLCLARIPAAYEIAPGDEGGTLTNGAANLGTISLGDLDMWSFPATAGESVNARIGAAGYRPYLLLYGPTGNLVTSGAGSGSGDTDADVRALIATSGTYTLVAQSYAANGTGPYTLHLAKSTGDFIVSPGDEGGELVNGAENIGQIAKGDIDVWRFDASIGDNMVVRIGSEACRPWIRLYDPNGVLIREGLAATSAENDTVVSAPATNSGTYRVIAQSYYYSLSSPYVLNLAKIPGSYLTSGGDQGGTLTNGLANLATNSLGDLDIWTFSANTGDYLTLRVGAPDFRPLMSLYGPGGVLIQTASGTGSAHRDASIFVAATNSGVFTVVQQSFYNDGVGPYTLSLGHFPGSYLVSPGDEGGRLTNGVSYDATIALGDLDLWNFAACKGYPFSLNLQKLGGTPFTPRLRLYARNGALLATAQNATMITLNYPGTNSGNYSVLIDGAGVNDSGTYRLTAYGIHDDDTLKLCPPIVAANTANLTGFGGMAASNFVLLTTTKVTTPLTNWTPLWTNQFDIYGAFDYTNSFTLSETQRFFRVRTDE
jgi:hypothetical protein